MSEGEEGRGIEQVCRALWVGAASLDCLLEGGGSRRGLWAEEEQLLGGLGSG